MSALLFCSSEQLFNTTFPNVLIIIKFSSSLYITRYPHCYVSEFKINPDTAPERIQYLRVYRYCYWYNIGTYHRVDLIFKYDALRGTLVFHLSAHVELLPCVY